MSKPTDLQDEATREAFLAARPRLAILTSNRREGTPIAVPVWFEWDGQVVRMFAATTSPKVKRLRRDPRASVLVTNHLDEGESWVAFDGKVTIEEGQGIELAERLAPRYWDLEDPERSGMLELWRQAKDALSLLTLEPTAIRTGS